MAIPKWVFNNPTTQPLVPLIQEAEAAGYQVDFGPTGKKHPSGKKIAADISHNQKRIRLDVTQIMDDFANKSWTKPQVEGVTPIEHDFADSGELAKFYLAHELEHIPSEHRKEVKADNENATNERAMKRMLPQPGVVRNKPVRKPEAASAPAASADLVPHAQELLHALNGLGRKSTSKNIKSVIDGLVGEGKVRPEAARLLATAVVFAQDRLRGVSEGGMVTTRNKPLDERYFEGTPQQLKEARTRARSGSRSFWGSSVPPEIGSVISEVFKSKEGKGYLMRALRSRMRSGKIADTENTKDMIREAGRSAKLAPEMSLTPPAESKVLGPERKMNIRPTAKPRATGSAAEQAQFMERPQDPARLIRTERSMIGNLQAGMTKVDKRKFESIKKRIAQEYPDYSEPKVNRIALMEMFPHFERFTRNYGRKMIEESRKPNAPVALEPVGSPNRKRRKPGFLITNRPTAEGQKFGRYASGVTQPTDQPEMNSPAGVIALRRLARRFGEANQAPALRRGPKLSRVQLK
jgi:hypothetical protein